MSNIIFEFNGGLGNQVFQYLASLYLQKKFKEYLFKYCISDYIKLGHRKLEINKVICEKVNLIDKDNIKLNKLLINKALTKFENLTKKNLFNFKNYLGCLNLISEKNLYYFYPELNSLESLKKIITEINFFKNSILKIIGYWQNPENYILQIDDFYNYFKDSYDDKTIFLKNKEYISIHIRRGDYISNKKTYSYYFSKFSPINYIISALSLLPQELNSLPIYIVTDDIKWVTQIKELIEENYGNKIYILSNNDPTTDWTILRNSKLNICANSTFSYSAAILNNKNIYSKLRCIVPQWISNENSAQEMGWISLPGFVEL